MAENKPSVQGTSGQVIALSQKVEIPPEVADAIAQERLVRDVAFLPVTENIAGYEVLPMNLEHLIILRLANNPLLYGKLPSPAQLAQFLWALNPSYQPASGAARRRFLRRCREFIPRSAPLFNFGLRRCLWERDNRERLERAAEIIDACGKYVFETFQDRPPHSAKGNAKEYYSDAAYFCVVMARECRMARFETMKTPLKCLFQFIKVIRSEKGAPMFNRTDALVADHNLKKLEAKP